MINIKLFPKSKLTHEELFLLCDAVCLKIDEIGADNLRIKYEYLNLKGSFYEFNMSLHKLKKGVYNKRRVAMTAEINGFIDRFFSKIQSFKTSRDTQLVEAMMVLMPVLSQYERKKRVDFEKKIEKNQKLASILRSEPYATAISTLDIAAYLDSLDVLNVNGINLLKMKMKENGLAQRIRKASIVRRELHIHYDKIVNRLNRLVMAYDKELYRPLFEWWNEYTGDLRLQLELRKMELMNPDNEETNMFDDEPIIT